MLCNTLSRSAGITVRLTGRRRAGCRMVWDLSFTCDICGKQKGESNHWWMARLEDADAAQQPEKHGADPARVAVMALDQPEPIERFTLVRWNAESCCDPELHHLCGQGCAMQASRAMPIRAKPAQPSPAAGPPDVPGPFAPWSQHSISSALLASALLSSSAFLAFEETGPRSFLRWLLFRPPVLLPTTFRRGGGREQAQNLAQFRAQAR